MNWVTCADQSVINADHVYRLFVTNDIMKGWQVKASVPGPQQPFVIQEKLPDRDAAYQVLQDLVQKIAPVKL